MSLIDEIDESLVRLREKIKTQAGKHKTALETKFKAAYDEYEKISTQFDKEAEKVDMFTSVKEGKALNLLDGLANEAKTHLLTMESLSGSLDKEVITAFKIKLDVVDPQQTLQEARKQIRLIENKLLHQAFPIESDEDLEYQIGFINGHYPKYTFNKKAYETKYDQYLTSRPQTDKMSVISNDKQLQTQKMQIVELGRLTSGGLDVLKRHAKNIKNYLAENPGKTLSTPLDVDLEILIKDDFSIKAYKQATEGKNKAEIVPLERLDTKEHLQGYLKEKGADLNDFKTGDTYYDFTFASELELEYNYIVGDHADFTRLMEAEDISKDIEAIREKLFSLRGRIEFWMSLYEEDSNQSSYTAQHKLLTDMYTAVQTNILAFGGFATMHDNFLEFRPRFEMIINTLDNLQEVAMELRSKKQALDTTQKELDKAEQKDKDDLTQKVNGLKKECTDLSELWKKNREHIEPIISTFVTDANTWCQDHKEKAFGLEKKRNTLQDYVRDINLKAVPLQIPLQIEGFKKLKKMLHTNYQADNDSLFKKIESERKTIEKLATSTNYRKRYRKLGDLNAAIQKWEMKYEHDHAEAVETTRSKVITIKEYWQHEFAIVNAHVSIEGLNSGMSNNLKKYVAMVKKFNESGGTYKKDFSKLLAGSNTLVEFVDVWCQQYKTLKSEIQKLGVDELLRIEKSEDFTKLAGVETEYLELRRIIVDNNLCIISGTSGLEKMNKLTQDIRQLEGEINSKLKDIDSLNEQLFDAAENEQKIRGLQSNIKKLKTIADKNPNGTEKAEIQKLERQVEELKLKGSSAELQQRINTLLEQVDAKELELKKAKENIFNSDDASGVFSRLQAKFEEKDAFEYDEQIVDVGAVAVRKAFLQEMLGMVQQWRSLVIDPNAKHLEHYKAQIDTIEQEAQRHLEQFSSKTKYTDEHYEKIVSVWNGVPKQDYETKAENRSKGAATRAALQYCADLISLWKKKNPVVIPSAADQHKNTNKWLGYCLFELASSRFELARHQEEIEHLINETKEAVKQCQKELDVKVNEFKGEQLYNAHYPEIDSVMKSWLDDVQKFLDGKKSNLVKFENRDLSTIRDCQRVKTDLANFANDLVERFKAKQLELHEELKEQERIIFSAISEDDYDYQNSGSFTPQQIQLMSKAIKNIADRARAILHSGGTPQEAEQMFEHLPVSLWPEEFVAELQAFRQVERALKEEEAQEQKRLAGQNASFFDVATEEQSRTMLSGILTSFSDVNSTLTKDEYNTSKKKYEAKYHDGSDQKTEHAIAATSISMISSSLDGLDSLIKFKDTITEEEKARAVAEYLFTGSISINDDGSSNAVVSTEDPIISERKKTIMRCWFSFTSSVTSIADSGIGQFGESMGDVQGLLQGPLKGVGEFFKGLVTAIDVTRSASEWERTTNEMWSKRINDAANIAKALVSVGKTTADITKLFMQIPSGVAPGLGIASSAIDLALDIKGIVEKAILVRKTHLLKNKAEIFDRSYVGPLKQEINTINRRIAKQAIDVVADGLAIAGGAATIAGGPAAGAGVALTIVAGVLKVANKAVFTAIDEALMKEARELQVRASKGDRNAMREIMSKSPTYAKMFIAIGATKNPPDSIAMQFLIDRGITEDDLKQESTAQWVVRKFIRTKLLAVNEESDKDQSKVLGPFASVAAKWRSWRAKVNKKEGFLQGKNQTYATLKEIYPLAELTKMAQATEEFWGDPSNYAEVFGNVPAKELRGLPVFHECRVIYKTLVDYNDELILMSRERTKELEALKVKQLEEEHINDTELLLQIEQLEEWLAGVGTQQQEIKPISTALNQMLTNLEVA